MNRWIASSVVGLSVCSSVSGQVTVRVSLANAGGQADDESWDNRVTPDGRYVVFVSKATNLVDGPQGGGWKVFLRDRLLGTTELVDRNSAGEPGNDDSASPFITPDARWISFFSRSQNLVPGDTNGWADVFIRDRQLGRTQRVSVSSTGVQGNSLSFAPSSTPDGRFVAFHSYSTNLVPDDTNNRTDVFVRDRASGTTERVSVSSAGVEGDGNSTTASISADGRFVVFDSEADNLIPNDTNGGSDIFLRDLQAQTTERVSVADDGSEPNSTSWVATISPDGRYVAFASNASNLVPGDTNGTLDFFVRDRLNQRTELVSLTSTGGLGNGYSGPGRMSSDGRFVAFNSDATNLVPGDTNGRLDVFLRDRLMGTTIRASVSSNGIGGVDHSYDPSVSDDGRVITFQTTSSNIVPNDTNIREDIFVHETQGSDHFTSACQPGSEGVRDCPCSNEPSGPGRGCDNSSSTGGAVLTAAGVAFLSVDSLVFTTSFERPNALSVLMQGNAALGAGAVYGQGVRCLGGTIIRRLFTKQAVGGSITAPETSSGDPNISARSLAKGDDIGSGESRWYLVYYRDPIVLGDCLASQTFNATQTGLVVWWP